jgi:Ca-activated chloride channel family protein
MSAPDHTAGVGRPGLMSWLTLALIALWALAWMQNETIVKWALSQGIVGEGATRSLPGAVKTASIVLAGLSVLAGWRIAAWGTWALYQLPPAQATGAAVGRILGPTANALGEGMKGLSRMLGGAFTTIAGPVSKAGLAIANASTLIARTAGIGLIAATSAAGRTLASGWHSGSTILRHGALKVIAVAGGVALLGYAIARLGWSGISTSTRLVWAGASVGLRHVAHTISTALQPLRLPLVATLAAAQQLTLLGVSIALYAGRLSLMVSMGTLVLIRSNVARAGRYGWHGITVASGSIAAVATIAELILKLALGYLWRTVAVIARHGWGGIATASKVMAMGAVILGLIAALAMKAVWRRASATARYGWLGVSTSARNLWEGYSFVLKHLWMGATTTGRYGWAALSITYRVARNIATTVAKKVGRLALIGLAMTLSITLLGAIIAFGAMRRVMTGTAIASRYGWAGISPLLNGLWTGATTVAQVIRKAMERFGSAAATVGRFGWLGMTITARLLRSGSSVATERVWRGVTTAAQFARAELAIILRHAGAGVTILTLLVGTALRYAWMGVSTVTGIGWLGTSILARYFWAGTAAVAKCLGLAVSITAKVLWLGVSTVTGYAVRGIATVARNVWLGISVLARYLRMGGSATLRVASLGASTAGRNIWQGVSPALRVFWSGVSILARIVWLAVSTLLNYLALGAATLTRFLVQGAALLGGVAWLGISQVLGFAWMGVSTTGLALWWAAAQAWLGVKALAKGMLRVALFPPRTLWTGVAAMPDTIRFTVLYATKKKGVLEMAELNLNRERMFSLVATVWVLGIGGFFTWSWIAPPPPPPTVVVEHWTTGHLVRDGLLMKMAEVFNEAGHRNSAGKLIQIKVHNVPSGLQAEYLTPRALYGQGIDLVGASNGYVKPGYTDPTIVTPSSAHWLTLVNHEVGRAVVDPATAEIIVRPVIGIVTYTEMAQCLGWPNKEIGFEDIIELRNNPRGWQSYPDCAKAEWGQTPLFAFTDPQTSSTGRSFHLSLYAMATEKDPAQLTPDDVHDAEVVSYVKEFQGLVDHYQIGTINLNTKIHQGPEFGHFFIMPEDNLIHLYEGTERAFINGKKVTAPPIKLGSMVMIYPKEGSMPRNNCACIVNEAWVTPEQKAAAKQWINFILEDEQQREFMAKGFRPGGDIALNDPMSKITSQYGLDPNKPGKVLNPSHIEPAVAAEIDATWTDVKRPGIVTWVVDKSGSMLGNKLEQAQEGMIQALDTMAPNNQVGFVTFDDKVNAAIPVSPLANIKFTIAEAVQSMRAGGETALYDAIKRGIEMTDSAAGEPNAIRAVVVLTDGQATGGSTRLDQIIKLASSREKPIQHFSAFEGDPLPVDIEGVVVNKNQVIGTALALNTIHDIQIFFIGIGEDADLDIGRMLSGATGADFRGVTEEDLAEALSEFSRYF